MEELLMKGYIKYAMLALTGLGILVHFMAALVCLRLIHQSENVPTSKSKLIKQIRLKFESCYRLNLGVNNIRMFVDKHLYKYKVCGLSLHGMRKFTILCGWIAGLTGLITGGACQFLHYGYRLGIEYEMMGVAAFLVVITFYLLLDTRFEQTIFITNMMDFLENSLVNHLAHQYAGGMKDLTPEEKVMMNEVPVLQQAVTREKRQASFDRTSHNNKNKSTMEEKKQQLKTYDPGIIEEVINQYLP